jgi:hypothetical protein
MNNAQLLNRVVSADVGFGSSQTITDKEHFYCRPNADETAGQYGTLRQGLAMWRYSVLRKPGLVLSEDMKMKIYSKARIYSSD